MQILSPPPSTSSFTRFPSFHSRNPNSLSNYRYTIPISPIHSLSSRDSSIAAILTEQFPNVSAQSLVSTFVENESDGISGSKIEPSMEEVVQVRRPDIDVPSGEDLEEVELKSENRTGSVSVELYRAKVLARNYRYREAEKVLEKCILNWGGDGRPYVALGKMLMKQLKVGEARAVYEKGCRATGGKDSYNWQCWAVLESRMGNVRKARELFDAATVANERNIAAWHGWAVLELKQGNIKEARNLLAKGLKYSGGNEYIYQTLALLQAKSNRYEQARYLFKQATKCNPKSCASWLAWAQLEMQQKNNLVARELFEKAIQVSPKNRFAWHIWGLFEANMGNVEKGRKLLKIGHVLNPSDPVLLQSLALLEYEHSSANIARVLLTRASELDPKHQPVWIAWGWIEWKEGNIGKARELYQRALSINSTSGSAARCLQAWGVLEQRVGNLSAARRLFRSSLLIDSQSYITWMTWASLEEDQGNVIRAEEIRNQYSQQCTEVVDEASWFMGFLDITDPTLDNINRLLKLEQDPFTICGGVDGGTQNTSVGESASSSSYNSNTNVMESETGFDLDAFIMKKLSIDTTKLEIQMEISQTNLPKRFKYRRRQLKSETREDMAVSHSQSTTLSV